jgi:hypothetical protein
MSEQDFYAGITALMRVQSKNVLNIDDVSVMLDVTPNRVRHMVNDRIIPHYKQNGKLYFRKSEIEDWLTAHRVPTNDEINAVGVTRCATRKRK